MDSPSFRPWQSARNFVLTTQPRVVNDTLAPNNPSDLYKITLTSASSVAIALEQLTTDTTLSLLNKSGGTIASSTNSGTLAETLQTSLEAGTYYIEVAAVTPTSPSSYQLKAAIATRQAFDLVWTNGAASEQLQQQSFDATESNPQTNAIAAPGSPWKLQTTGDLNRDGIPDLVWRNMVDGTPAVWLMNGDRSEAVILPNNPNLNEILLGLGDFNRDGNLDILWSDPVTNQPTVWYMNGAQRLQVASLQQEGDPTWSAVGVGDFNGDGGADVVWRNRGTGNHRVWLLNQGIWQAGPALERMPDRNWSIRLIADLNSDGQSDLVVQHATTGASMVWYMDGVTRAASQSLPTQSVLPSAELVANSATFWRPVGAIARSASTNAAFPMAGTTPQTALEVGVLDNQGRYTNELRPDRNSHYYHLMIPTPRSLNAALLPEFGRDANLRLYHDSNYDGQLDFSELIAQSNRGTGQAEVLNYWLLPGSYFLEVHQFPQESTPYRLQLSNSLPVRWPSNGSDVEELDTTPIVLAESELRQLDTSPTLTGTLNANNTLESYEFEIDQDSKLNVNLSGNRPLTFQILTQTGTIVRTWTSTPPAEVNQALEPEPFPDSVATLARGTYYAVLYSSAPAATTQYALTLTQNPIHSRVSVLSPNVQTDGASGLLPTISADGRYVVFASRSTDLVRNDTNEAADIFIYDRTLRETQRISVASNGTQGNGDVATGIASAISANGQFVVFVSNASNLVADDTNDTADVFVHDRTTGQTRRISIATDGTQGNGASGGIGTVSLSATGDVEYPSLQGDALSISADGRYIAFSSTASNLVADDTNGVADIFIHDRTTGQTQRMTANGIEANGASGGAMFTRDGQSLVFYSSASNLVAGDTNGVIDLFVYNRTTQTIQRVNLAADGTQANATALSTPAISGDGRYVAFVSRATNLTADDRTPTPDIFIYDLQTRQTRRISQVFDQAGIRDTNTSRYGVSLSQDGRYVAFYASTTPGTYNVFVYDQVTGTTQRVGTPLGNSRSAGNLFGASISADGRYVTFTSAAADLIADDTNGVFDVFVYDRGA